MLCNLPENNIGHTIIYSRQVMARYSRSTVELFIKSRKGPNILYLYKRVCSNRGV